MKDHFTRVITVIFGLIFATTAMIVSGSNISKSAESKSRNLNSFAKYQKYSPAETTSSSSVASNAPSVKEIMNAYLQMKNALTEDNSTGAAASGKKLQAAFKNFDKTALTAAQRKIYDDVEDDAKEHSEHIGLSGGNIAHQREHFEMLSKDIYDLVKAFGGGQVLYKDFDPMFNNGKGAYWISETKEIKNPYMGKAMLTSGSVTEEIK